MNTSKNIEVELRARFNEEVYTKLLKNLQEKAKDLGTDDKRVWFFVMSDKLLKVTHNVSKQSGKITLKLTKIGHGNSFEEIEFPIDADDIEKAVQLFTLLGHNYLVEPTILRHDFEYKGVEIAVKYSKTWGYHAEFEILTDSKDNEAVAEQQIRAVAEELGIALMTEEELRAFTQNIEATYINPTNLPSLK